VAADRRLGRRRPQRRLSPTSARGPARCSRAGLPLGAKGHEPLPVAALQLWQARVPHRRSRRTRACGRPAGAVGRGRRRARSRQRCGTPGTGGPAPGSVRPSGVGDRAAAPRLRESGRGGPHHLPRWVRELDLDPSTTSWTGATRRRRTAACCSSPDADGVVGIALRAGERPVRAAAMCALCRTTHAPGRVEPLVAPVAGRPARRRRVHRERDLRQQRPAAHARLRPPTAGRVAGRRGAPRRGRGAAGSRPASR